MAVVHPCLFEIIKIFPQQKNKIIYLHKNNHTFRSICSDLNKCRDAYQHWSQQDSSEAKLREQEYRELVENLWSEIERYVQNNCLTDYTSNNR